MRRIPEDMPVVVDRKAWTAEGWNSVAVEGRRLVQRWLAIPAQ
jgi:hypothetical protein